VSIFFNSWQGETVANNRVLHDFVSSPTLY
jgi:hypothetical protein